MKKAQIYRIIGKVFVLLWLMVVGSMLWWRYLYCARLRHIGFNFGIGEVISIVTMNFFFNPFLLIGSIFLLRADRNENPSQKPKSLRFVVCYSVLFICVFTLVITSIVHSYKKAATRIIDTDKSKLPIEELTK